MILRFRFTYYFHKFKLQCLKNTINPLINAFLLKQQTHRNLLLVNLFKNKFKPELN